MADTATTSPDPTAELHRLGKSIRRHSQALSRDLAQMRDLLAEFGIEFTLVPLEGTIDSNNERTRR